MEGNCRRGEGQSDIGRLIVPTSPSKASVMQPQHVQSRDAHKGNADDSGFHGLIFIWLMKGVVPLMADDMGTSLWDGGSIPPDAPHL